MEEYEKEIIDSQRILENYAIMLTKDTEDAHDLLQETVLRILTNIDKYEDKGCFRAWAKLIMQRVFLNNTKKVQKHKMTFINGHDYINDEIHHPQVSESNDEYSKEEIEKAIGSLSPKSAKMITMQMCGYKYEEIAIKMNITTGCVKSTIHSARKQLRRILK